ncbi:MAG: ISKra4 family transposase [Bacteroidetes bacterium]|jgi:hypothetical protein|nr:ISKra4 family transposase [Bacteroidota bacterium]
MNIAYLNSNDFSFFSGAQEQLEQLIQQLQSEHYAKSEHGDIEKFINKEGQEILRRLLQGWLDLIASNEESQDHINSVLGDQLNHIRSGTTRTLKSLFGDVTVTRKGYSQINKSSLYPIDAELNLSDDSYSDGIRYRVSNEAVRGSFDDVVETVGETTGGHVPKRQSLNIVRDVAQDFEVFYHKTRFIKPEESSDLLVLTFDGKGIVMRPDSLRECTKKAAQKSKKLKSRLSQGEKKDRKRMAQVAAVYTVQPHIRTGESIMKISEEEDNVLPFRTPIRNKRVWASVEREAEVVIEEAFLEALQRDPEQKRHWVILIDGLPQQIRLIKKIMKKLTIKATIVMDFIHVLEYLWKAAWCFFDKGDEAVEKWIAEKSVNLLKGRCSQVAKGIRISATKQKITNRENIDKCADYLLKNKERLRYGEALKAGFPIASGVIEGACRHLINDRLDITGARWSLKGAEAILKLRSLKSSGDLKTYWKFHKKMSKQRNYSFLEVNNFG